jgi:hypothetical protein
MGMPSRPSAGRCIRHCAADQGHPAHTIMRITVAPVSVMATAIAGGNPPGPRLVSRMRPTIAAMAYSRVIATHVLGLISYPASSSALTTASACLIAKRASTLRPLSLACSARALAITVRIAAVEYQWPWASHNVRLPRLTRAKAILPDVNRNRDYRCERGIGGERGPAMGAKLRQLPFRVTPPTKRTRERSGPQPRRPRQRDRRQGRAQHP